MQGFNIQSAAPLMLPIVLLVSMYFVVYLPQKRREKNNFKMLGSLEVNMEVVTIGGIIGKILNIKDDELIIETGVEKTKLKIKKWAVRDVLSRQDSKDVKKAS